MRGRRLRMSEDSSRKWRAERGASLSMALLFILVAAMVGFVIVTAASVLTGRAVSSGGVSRTAADQRQYVLRSTARLIQEELVGTGGAQVCYQAGSQDNPTGEWIDSRVLEEGIEPAWNLDSASTAGPRSVLEYLVWEAIRQENPDTITQPEYWEPTKVGEEGLSDIYEYQIDLLIKLSVEDLSTSVYNAVKGSNSAAKDEVQILCRLHADRNLNITAKVGFCSGWAEGSIHTSTTANTFAGEVITFTLTSTRTDFPESTYTDPATGNTTSTTRAMYVWQAA